MSAGVLQKQKKTTDLESCTRYLHEQTLAAAPSFTLLERRTNRRFSLPAEPVLSPDRQRIVTADVCLKHCSNEIAVWRMSSDGLRKELAWSPGSDWVDAAAQWKDADTLSVDYSIADQRPDAKLERKLTDPAWTRLPPP